MAAVQRGVKIEPSFIRDPMPRREAALNMRAKPWHWTTRKREKQSNFHGVFDGAESLTRLQRYEIDKIRGSALCQRWIIGSRLELELGLNSRRTVDSTNVMVQIERASRWNEWIGDALR